MSIFALMKSQLIKDEVLRLYKEGKTYKEITILTNCTKSTIWNICSGIALRLNKFDRTLIPELQFLYDNGETLKQLSLKYGLALSTLKCYIKQKRKSKRSIEDKRKLSVKYVTQRRRKIKSMAVEYKGGKCVFCDYNKCNEAMDFHHIDPSKKQFTISKKGNCVSWEKVKIELAKCILVCRNCHSELHAGLIDKDIVSKFCE